MHTWNNHIIYFCKSEINLSWSISKMVREYLGYVRQTHLVNYKWNNGFSFLTIHATASKIHLWFVVFFLPISYLVQSRSNCFLNLYNFLIHFIQKFYKMKNFFYSRVLLTFNTGKLFINKNNTSAHKVFRLEPDQAHLDMY